MLGKDVGAMVGAGAAATAGAVTLDWLFANLVPAKFQVAGAKPLIKGVGALGLGLLGRKVVKKTTADAFAVGGLTVAMYDFVRQLIVKAAPTVKLDGVGYSSASIPVGSPPPGGLYPPPGMNGMGLYSRTNNRSGPRMPQRPGGGMGLYRRR